MKTSQFKQVTEAEFNAVPKPIKPSCNEVVRELMQLQCSANSNVLTAYQLAAFGSDKVSLLRLGDSIQKLSDDIETLRKKLA